MFIFPFHNNQDLHTDLSCATKKLEQRAKSSYSFLYALQDNTGIWMTKQSTNQTLTSQCHLEQVNLNLVNSTLFLYK